MDKALSMMELLILSERKAGSVFIRRNEAYLRMLEFDGATVVWIGLPPMKSDKYNAHIALVNRIAYTVVGASPHAVWFSSGGTVGDDTGQFRDFGLVANHTVRLRQSDGIHLSDDGAALLTAKAAPVACQKEDEESVKRLQRKRRRTKPLQSRRRIIWSLLHRRGNPANRAMSWRHRLSAFDSHYSSEAA